MTTPSKLFEAAKASLRSVVGLVALVSLVALVVAVAKHGVVHQRFASDRWKSASIESGERGPMESDLLRQLQDNPAIDMKWMSNNLGEPDFFYEPSEDIPRKTLVYGIERVAPESPGETAPVRVLWLEIDRAEKLSRRGTTDMHHELWSRYKKSKVAY